MSKIKDLYREIWAERAHVCAACGYPLSRPVANVFSHIKGKGAHPALKFEKSNIELLCSTIIRADGEIGCHESLHTNPRIIKRRREKI
jgi:hypothetical protein